MKCGDKNCTMCYPDFQKGFTLLEMVLVTGVMSLIALGLCQLMYVQTLQQVTTDTKNAAGSIVTSMQGVASNTTACTQAVTQVTQLYGHDMRFDMPQGMIISNNSKPTTNLIVKSLKYSNAVVNSVGYDGTTVYYGDLFINFTASQPMVGSRDFASRYVISTYLTVGPDGTITACGPTLPTLPVAPPPAAPDNTPNNDFIQGCSAIGGTMSDGHCILNNNSPCDHGH